MNSVPKITQLTIERKATEVYLFLGCTCFLHLVTGAYLQKQIKGCLWNYENSHFGDVFSLKETEPLLFYVLASIKVWVFNITLSLQKHHNKA